MGSIRVMAILVMGKVISHTGDAWLVLERYAHSCFRRMDGHRRLAILDGYPPGWLDSGRLPYAG
jgi:hypothetical protein